MKKAFLLGAIVCALGMMTACKSGTADENTNDTLQPASEVVPIEPPTETGYGPVWDELERLTNKIYVGDTLLPKEWSFLFEHIDTLDGGLAEGIGCALYEVLAGPRYSEHVAQEGLAHLSPEKREHVLKDMMWLMAIDIMEDDHTYTWDEFTARYPVFEGSKAAEKALEGINEMKKEESNQ